MANENLESKRWWIAVAAIIMQLCLGCLYAWSVYKKPLMASHEWGETALQVTFMIAVGVIGIACAFGGTFVDKKGPRFVATVGGILYGGGTIIAGLSDQIGNIWLLYLGYGLIAGLGNGACYITPIATLLRWFPDKRGLITGMAVMGYGAGAFFMGKIAPPMIISMGVANTFYVWGVIFLVLCIGAAQLYKNPPKGWLPAGFVPKAATVSAADSYNFEEAVKTPQWWMLWAILFLNVCAGIGLISQLSPLGQDIVKKVNPDFTAAALAVAGGSIVAYAAIGNGVGRFCWAAISDYIGRRNVFIIMLFTQAILYFLLPYISSVFLFTIVACYLLACYGGGFATMPAFVTDSFGPSYIGKVYGIMLTAWGAAGVVGPFVFASFKGIALQVAAGLLVVGLIIAISFKRPKSKKMAT